MSTLSMQKEIVRKLKNGPVFPLFCAFVLAAVSIFAAHSPAQTTVHSPGWVALPVDLGAGLVLSWQRWACGRWEVPAATHALANLLVVLG